MLYLINAIGLTAGGSSTAHIYTQTIHTTQNKQYTEQHKIWEECRAVPRLCELYPGICLTTEEKAWGNLSRGSQRVPANHGSFLPELAEKKDITPDFHCICQ